jgi:hypothetical protein
MKSDGPPRASLGQNDRTGRNPSDTRSQPHSVSPLFRPWRLEGSPALRRRPATPPHGGESLPLASSLSLPRPWPRLSTREEDGAARSSTVDGDGHRGGSVWPPHLPSCSSTAPASGHGSGWRQGLCPRRGLSLSAVAGQAPPLPGPSSQMPLRGAHRDRAGQTRPETAAFFAGEPEAQNPVSFLCPLLGFLCWWGYF